MILIIAFKDEKSTTSHRTRTRGAAANIIAAPNSKLE